MPKAKAKRPVSGSKRNSKPSPNVGKMQLISWLDHTSTSNRWQDVADTKVILTNHSIGLIQFEDDQTVTLIRDWCHENAQVSSGMNIIKSCITKRRTLK